MGADKNSSRWSLKLQQYEPVRSDPRGHTLRTSTFHLPKPLLTVYFGTPSMFITLWFGFDYGTNPPLGTLII
jgi:hypothetical protein